MNQEEKSIFLNYLEVYLRKRDLSSTIKMLSPTMTGFGTGLDEICYDYETALKLYERDINSITAPIDYEIESLKIQKPSDNVFIVFCEFSIKAFFKNYYFKFNHLRLSMTWVKHEKNWLIESMHISFPTDVHKEGEAYPIKEIEEQNIVLQRLLNEKTEKFNQAISEIRRQAITDRLTNLYNRMKIEEVLTEEIEKAKRYQTIFSVILLDLDHFKEVNDDFGHIVGDRLLVEFANILSRRVRKADICGRWGGEEFIIVCPNTNLEKSYILAEDLRKIIENYKFDTVGHKTASFGVASYKANDSIESIINRADSALYAAKQSGRNKVLFEK